MQQEIATPVDLKVLMNHIYEYKKGVRRLVLYTFNKKYESFAITRLERQNIDYIIQPVGNDRLNLFFVRPRRFGKSLFLSMLYSYYDCNQKESFEKLFGNLWIGQHPTSLQGIYQVLFLGDLPVHDRFFGIF